MPDPVLSLYDTLARTTPGTLKVRLFSKFSPSGNVPQLSDFVEAVYPGYQPLLNTPAGPGNTQADGSLLLSLPNLTFAVGITAGEGCDVAGTYTTLLQGSSECVVDFTVFDSAITMQKPGDYCQFSFGISAGIETLPSM